MKCLGIIPARANSTRFPNKIIANINSKPMIQYVWDAASRAKLIDELLIATDDNNIANVCEKFGARVILTPSVFNSGTDRVAWVSRMINADIVLNLQGDEPLIKSEAIDKLVLMLKTDIYADMATFVVKIKDSSINNPNIVKVAVSSKGYITKFSRFFTDSFYKHVGIYCFRYEALQKFSTLKPTQSEIDEKLEQLRALDNGFKIKAVELNEDTIAVDVPDDIILVENYLEKNIDRSI